MIRLILQSRLARLIGTVLAALAAVLTFGAFKKREGAAENQAKVAAEKAADFAETIREVSNETATSEPVDAIRQRLRDRAKRKP